MDKTKRIAFGIGTVLAVLTAFIAPAMAGPNTVYFVPRNSSAGPDETIEVDVLVNITDPYGYDPEYAFATIAINVTFDSSVGDIISCDEPDEHPWDVCWMKSKHGDSWYVTAENEPWDDPEPPYGLGPGIYPVANFTIKGVSPGEMDLLFDFEQPRLSEMVDAIGDPMPNQSWVIGTFTCVAPTYTISGYTTPAADTVKITNLNNSKEWAADYIGSDGFYNLTLDVGVDVNATEILQITACDEIASDEYRNESNCNVTTHVPVNIPGEDTNVNLTLNHYCLHYHSYPYRTWEQPNWSGPAVMQMMVDHYRPEEPTQTYLNETGIAHNQQPCNANLSYVDPKGMQWTLNYILHNTSSYGGGKYANYGIGSYDDNLSALHYICFWQHLGPGAAPAYGDYSNWMAIRGIHTSEDPYPGPYPPAGNYDIYGFWINDPNPTGIGENSYKTVDQWTSEYYLKLSGVRGCDNYLNKYVAVCEPPEQPDVEVKPVHSPARLDKPVDPELMGLDVVKAAIDGATEELVPYDTEFAAVFAKTIAGEPMLVTDDDGNDYYLVPFEVPVEKRPIPIPLKKPVEIQKVEGKAVKLLSLDLDGENAVERVTVRSLKLRPIKEERTLAVVIVDAEDGSFKEALWVKEPVKYLPVSKAEALGLVFKKLRQDGHGLRLSAFGRPTIELVHRDASPYYPDWKITIGQMVFYVSQDGTVSCYGCDKPEPPQYSSYLTVDIEEHICDGIATEIDPIMAGKVEYYVCEEGIQACAPIGPGCLAEEIAQEIIEASPTEAWYITDEPVGVVVPCPAQKSKPRLITPGPIRILPI